MAWENPVTLLVVDDGSRERRLNGTFDRSESGVELLPLLESRADRDWDRDRDREGEGEGEEEIRGVQLGGSKMAIECEGECWLNRVEVEEESIPNSTCFHEDEEEALKQEETRGKSTDILLFFIL